ncbi:MAG: ribulose-phosphate 3-epimerase [Saprospiraceae bacterium]|nr:ribulose-phosphate 3-epimerase [Saprospiraceae bacterium]
MKKYLLAPSILAADFGQLDNEIEFLNQSLADWIHIDVMDGSFVPNISFGQMLVKQMKKNARLPLDVHLMIVDPEKYVDSFIEAGADVVSFHLEATNHAHRLIQHIQAQGIKAGVAINPQTSVDALDDILEDADLIVLMSVNPGFGGQKFIYRTMEKLKTLKSRIMERNLNTMIEIDGGVGLQNASVLIEHGADVLVAGSAVFKSEDPALTIERMKGIEVGNFEI